MTPRGRHGDAAKPPRRRIRRAVAIRTSPSPQARLRAAEEKKRRYERQSKYGNLASADAPEAVMGLAPGTQLSMTSDPTILSISRESGGSTGRRPPCKYTIRKYE